MKLKLLTAILMTVAAVVWGASLFTTVYVSGDWPALNVIVFLTFAALAVVYWMMYFRLKNSTSGTE